MNSRERFEAYYSSNGENPNSVARSTNGHYLLTQTFISWKDWQAAKRDMLERAIAEFDGDDTAEYSCKEIQIILKELLND
jgi:hypothetical protein